MSRFKNKKLGNYVMELCVAALFIMMVFCIGHMILYRSMVLLIPFALSTVLFTIVKGTEDFEREWTKNDA